MQGSENQKKNLKEIIDPAPALRLALGHWNQIIITNSHSALQVNAVTPQRQFRNSNRRPNFQAQTRQANQLCQNCGITCSANQKDKCIAKCKDCKSCVLQNHFPCVCRKPRSTSTKTTRPNVNSIDVNTTDNSVNAILSENYNSECRSDYDGYDDNLLAMIANNTLQIEPKNTTLQIGNTKVGLIIDSGSVCSVLISSLATEVNNNSTLARWLTTAPSKELKTFSNRPIPRIEMMQTSVESNGRRIEDAE